MNGIIFNLAGRVANPGLVLGLAALLGLAGCATCPSCGGGDGCDAGGNCGGNGLGAIRGSLPEPGNNGVAIRSNQWDLIDRAYPQRYSHMAIKEVNDGMAPQVQNGQILDQTIWTYYFEPGTDRLTPAGLEHLAYIVRRRPCPDTTVYLQTANDLVYDPACPERFAGARQELDGLRTQAIQKFLVASSAGRPADFVVITHDPGDTTIPAVAATPAFNGYVNTTKGRLVGAGGGGGGGAAAGR
jgi:hypothetical protein